MTDFTLDYAWFDLVGSLGVCLILFCYLFLHLDKLQSKDLIYSFLNALGAALILVSLYFDFNFSAFMVELFWLLISLSGFVRQLLSKQQVKVAS